MTNSLKIKTYTSLALFLLSIPCMGDPLSLPTKIKISINHHKTAHVCELTTTTDQLRCDVKDQRTLTSRSLFISKGPQGTEILEFRNGQTTPVGQACYQMKLDKNKLILNLLSETKCALATARLDKLKFDPKAIVKINTLATKEASKRLRIDFARTQENPIEVLVKEKPHVYEVFEFVAKQTGVPIEYLLETADHESHFNRHAAKGPWKGFGQFDKKTWAGTLKNPEFIQLYSQIYPNRLKPERGSCALADVLAIAINAKFAANKYQTTPGLTPQFILTSIGVHALGAQGAKSLVAKLKEPDWEKTVTPKRFINRYKLALKLSRDRTMFEARAQNP